MAEGTRITGAEISGATSGSWNVQADAKQPCFRNILAGISRDVSVYGAQREEARLSCSGTDLIFSSTGLIIPDSVLGNKHGKVKKRRKSRGALWKEHCIWILILLPKTLCVRGRKTLSSFGTLGRSFYLSHSVSSW